MSADKGSTQPQPFLRKTWDILNDESNASAISWSPSGTSFIVWQPAEFARDVLPVYFKHNNFSSFVRQLNTYGFRKVESDRWEFANDDFRRDSREAMNSIQRRKPASSSSYPDAAAQRHAQQAHPYPAHVEHHAQQETAPRAPLGRHVGPPQPMLVRPYSARPLLPPLDGLTDMAARGDSMGTGAQGMGAGGGSAWAGAGVAGGSGGMGMGMEAGFGVGRAAASMGIGAGSMWAGAGGPSGSAGMSMEAGVGMDGWPGSGAGMGPLSMLNPTLEGLDFTGLDRTGSSANQTQAYTQPPPQLQPIVQLPQEPLGRAPSGSLLPSACSAFSKPPLGLGPGLQQVPLPDFRASAGLASALLDAVALAHSSLRTTGDTISMPGTAAAASADNGGMSKDSLKTAAPLGEPHSAATGVAAAGGGSNSVPGGAVIKDEGARYGSLAINHSGLQGGSTRDVAWGLPQPHVWNTLLGAPLPAQHMQGPALAATNGQDAAGQAPQGQEQPMVGAHTADGQGGPSQDSLHDAIQDSHQRLSRLLEAYSRPVAQMLTAVETGGMTDRAQSSGGGMLQGLGVAGSGEGQGGALPSSACRGRTVSVPGGSDMAVAGPQRMSDVALDGGRLSPDEPAAVDGGRSGWDGHGAGSVQWREAGGGIKRSRGSSYEQNSAHSGMHVDRTGASDMLPGHPHGQRVEGACAMDAENAESGRPGPGQCPTQVHVQGTASQGVSGTASQGVQGMASKGMQSGSATQPGASTGTSSGGGSGSTTAPSLRPTSQSTPCPHPGLLRPVPQSVPGLVQELLCEMVGQMGRLAGLATEVHGLREQNQQLEAARSSDAAQLHSMEQRLRLQESLSQSLGQRLLAQETEADIQRRFSDGLAARLHALESFKAGASNTTPGQDNRQHAS